MEVQTVDTMPPEEMSRVYKRAQAGDRTARNAIIMGNMGLVRTIAKRYVRHHTPLDDLLHEGVIGLTYAINKWRPELGAFSTYATPWIHQAVSRAAHENDALLHIPEYVRLNLRHAENGTKLPPGIQRATPENMRAAKNGQHMRSLSSSVRNTADIVSQSGESNAKLSDLLPDGETADMEAQIVARLDDAEVIARLMQRAKLTPRQRQVIEARYGLDGGGERTFLAVGKVLGLTRQRVEQIEHSALTKLRNAAIMLSQSTAA